jgi:hypothetical protein
MWRCTGRGLRNAWRAQPDGPDFVCVLQGRGLRRRARAAKSASAPLPGWCSGFAEDVADADDGVLDVGAGFALEAERVFEVEGDDGAAGELEHEVAQRADGDLLGDLLAFGFGAVGLAGVVSALRVARMSLSMRSSALTPKPLRPLTSM